jgi:hypothetical protein
MRRAYGDREEGVMGQVTTGSLSDLDALIPSWTLSLKAENESVDTVASYTYATTPL